MSAAVLWTINDFHAYAMLSGWSTYGKKACPQCMDDTNSIRLKHGKKQCFMGHRHWLPIEHRFRRMTIHLMGRRSCEAPQFLRLV